MSVNANATGFRRLTGGQGGDHRPALGKAAIPVGLGQFLLMVGL